MNNSIPDGLPTLSAGAHSPGSGKACILEYVSLLAGEPWSADPTCTHPVLAGSARATNDRISDANRHLLVPLIGRLFGTSESGTPLERQILSVRLATFAARSVLHLATDEGQAEAAIKAAESWTDDPCKATREAAYTAYTACAAYDDAYDAYSAAAAVNAAGNAARAAYADIGNAYAARTARAAYAARAVNAARAAYAARAVNAARAAYTAAYVAYSAAAGATAAGNAARAAYADAYGRDQVLADGLTALIDEYDRLTGRTTWHELSHVELADLAAAI